MESKGPRFFLWLKCICRKIPANKLSQIRTQLMGSTENEGHVCLQRTKGTWQEHRLFYI